MPGRRNRLELSDGEGSALNRLCSLTMRERSGRDERNCIIMRFILAASWDVGHELTVDSEIDG